MSSKGLWCGSFFTFAFPLHHCENQVVARGLGGSLPSTRWKERAHHLGWRPPQAGWRTLNIDGASNGNPTPAGAGGVIRDSSRQWVSGFVANIGTTSAAQAELWAFSYGLDLAWNTGCMHLNVESDSCLAIQLISSRHDPVHPYATLLSAIRRKVSHDWLVRITHTYREGNRVADWFSKHSLVYPYGTHELANPPSGLIHILCEDTIDTIFERRVVTHSDPFS
ncbi:unnamed protein product [Linum trigynum]|uniref:RNase H type-1 domain-containing protein n=1 Tax=Linum trigynum TaxID=586398 RepID=A0AAV2GEM7_9ROSI